VSARLAHAVATVCGLGDRLPAPGTTVGSLAALLAFLGVATAAPAALPAAAAALALVLAALAVWACGSEAAKRGEHDPGAIVADEVAGQWLALAVVAVAVARPPTPVEAIVSFALFRVFDIAKPWPIRRLERIPGGWGIVADDLAAGLAAAVAQLLAMRLTGGGV
jgi:phosphatidylglycerophosphatase A